VNGAHTSRTISGVKSVSVERHHDVAYGPREPDVQRARLAALGLRRGGASASCPHPTRHREEARLGCRAAAARSSASGRCVSWRRTISRRRSRGRPADLGRVWHRAAPWPTRQRWRWTSAGGSGADARRAEHPPGRELKCDPRRRRHSAEGLASGAGLGHRSPSTTLMMRRERSRPADRPASRCAHRSPPLELGPCPRDRRSPSRR
jgi:hypothetical protein